MSTADVKVPLHAGTTPEAGATLYIEGVIDGPWVSVAASCEGDVVTMSAPRRGGAPIGLRPGREFLLCYSVRAVPCEVDASWVDGPRDVGGESIATVRMRGAPRRLQRRNAVRVPVNLIVRARPVAEGDEAEGDADAPASVAVVTENLSAGGALMRMDDPLPVDTLVTVTIDGFGEGAVDLASRVVRCDHDPSALHPWRVAVAFTDLSGTEEENLVRYVFRIQREARARESGMGG